MHGFDKYGELSNNQNTVESNDCAIVGIWIDCSTRTQTSRIDTRIDCSTTADAYVPRTHACARQRVAHARLSTSSACIHQMFGVSKWWIESRDLDLRSTYIHKQGRWRA